MVKIFRNLRVIAAVAVMLVAVGCASEKRVVIISTNDIHASIDNFPRLATLVEEIRAANGEDAVILTDAGDRWTGNPFVDIAERPLYPVVELMNRLGYDVATLGNHEFDWGQAMLDERVGEMNFPVVCANLDTGTSALSSIEPYTIIEAGGLRIAFLGLVTNFVDGHPDGKLENFVGMSFTNPYDAAEKYAWLADECDVFVALTHIGDNADEILAERVPQLDLILGGHSHTRIDTARVVGKTAITQSDSKLKYAGVTTVTKKGKSLTIENHLVPLADIAPAEDFAAMVERYNDNPALHASIGEVAAPFDAEGVRNLVTDAIRAQTGVDLVLYHRGGIRISELPAGGVSFADLFRIEPFRSEVYTMDMTAGDIKGLIMAKFNDTGNAGESHGPDLYPSGLTYEIITDEAGEAVDVRFLPVERDRYKVALPDYVCKVYKFNKPAAMVETGLQVTSILKSYIEAHSPLIPDDTPRIEIR
ncbi:MAG: bifunctional metallophosphatase/5'-nucleotidase [Rikenellaceae bacterium]|jgi:5'-nucleotidase|nr:bifunctional metallophosphatase/5'-nucleotidase [Rikenellaceae bacterium]